MCSGNNGSEPTPVIQWKIGDCNKVHIGLVSTHCMATRRAVLRGLAGAVMTITAGCTDAVVNTDTQCSIGRVIDGGACEILLENNGPPGDLRVIVETRDANGNVLGTRSEVVNVGFGDSVRVNINPALHREMDHLTARAERA